MKRCRICGSLCQDDAYKCSFCNSDFAPNQISARKTKPLPNSKPPKSPMEGIAVLLFLLALSFLPTIPIAFAISEMFLEPEANLFLCWIIIFIVALIVYRIATANANTKQRHLEYHTANDASVMHPESAAYESGEHPLQTAEQAYAPENYPPMQFSNSAFSAALYDACRRTDYQTIPTYDVEMNCSTACAHLAGHYTKDTHTFDNASARTILAAMAARRAILLCGNDDAELARVITNISDLTGETTCAVKIGRNCVTPNDLCIAEGTAEMPLPSMFLRSLYAAQMRQKSICSFLLDAEAPDKLGMAMADLKPYLENGMIESRITVKGTNRSYSNIALDEMVILPANTRLFIVFRPGSSVPMPRDLMNVCAFVNLKEDLSKPEALSDVFGALSFERLSRLCNDAEERYALSEENWKKIDDLFEKLIDVSTFVLDNQTITAMERFVGVYMAAGGSEQEALDAVFASLLLPAVLTAPLAAANEDAPALSQLLDDHFGLENLPACAEMLKKFSAA